MHNTFRRRLIFILLAALAIWVFLWYTYSLVERLSRDSRRNCETIALLWAGVQYPLSVVSDQRGLMTCSECGHSEFPGQIPVAEERRYCPVCGDTTTFIRTDRLLPEEREDITRSTRHLFSEIVNRLDFPTIFVDSRGTPQIVDGVPVEGLSGHELEDIRIRMHRMSMENPPIPLSVRDDTIGYLFYGTPELNSEIALMPFLELGLLLVAAAVIFLLLRSELNTEKNMSWVGFARETAHQLSTPLSSLMGWLELLREEDPVMRSHEAAEAVSHMSADVRRLAQIADRYGQMGRETRLTPLSMKEVITETAEYFNVRKGLLGKGVILEIPGEILDVMIMGNKPLMGWVLENLIKNAAAACANRTKGCRISIDCRVNQDDARKVELLVSDNGSGIPYADQGKIFNAGFTTRKGGWGLGLSLARRIVEEYHGGSITLLTSTPGRGTTFRILLPMLEGGDDDHYPVGG